MNLKLILNHENFNFDNWFSNFENLKKKNSDRYQYILPYYNFNKKFRKKFFKKWIN